MRRWKGGQEDPTKEAHKETERGELSFSILD